MEPINTWHTWTIVVGFLAWIVCASCAIWCAQGNSRLGDRLFPLTWPLAVSVAASALGIAACAVVSSLRLL